MTIANHAACARSIDGVTGWQLKIHPEMRLDTMCDRMTAIGLELARNFQIIHRRVKRFLIKQILLVKENATTFVSNKTFLQSFAANFQ
ncbi:hypothetical protein D3C87_1904940 [compost metagenome]